MHKAQDYNYFIAKTYKKDNSVFYYPLWSHLFDVYNVARILWEKVFPKKMKEEILDVFELSKDSDFIPFLICLHDIGKATPDFQLKYCKEDNILANFPQGKNYTKPHNHYTGALINMWAEEKQFNSNQKSFLKNIGFYLASHHGKMVSKSEIREAEYYLNKNEKWKALQIEFIDELFNFFNVDIPDVNIDWDKEHWLIDFLGLTTYADWLGSMQEYFPLIDYNYDKKKYFEDSKTKAMQVVNENHILNIAAIQDKSFKDLFNNYMPRGIQKSIESLLVNNEPSLTVIEAPTGEGKTEAALYLASKIEAKKKGNGIFIAMPTQATSNSIYIRFNEFLLKAHNFEKCSINSQLIHGKSNLSNKVHDSLEKEFEVQNTEDDKAIHMAEWFLNKKRALLAPYGAGTIDQAFLSVLNVKFFYLRLLGLSGKTIIFDEVHAYDTYMSALFQRLLSWLKELKSNVIILSATLPEETRSQLLTTWAGRDINPDNKAYPLINHVSGNLQIIDNIHVNKVNNKKININLIPDVKLDIIQRVKNDVSKGANVAVIVNTVRRAQEFYMLIDNEDFEKYIFHSRYIYRDRIEIENKIKERFGKGNSKQGALIIATQVIEQSLDLDFDVMYSDIAPIDLLLQRVGRLHRHHKENRPVSFRNVEFNIIVTTDDDALLPNLDSIAGIYPDLILWRTLRKLKEKPNWQLPDDYRDLIESVYYPATEEAEGDRLIADCEEDLRLKLREAIQEIENENINSKRIAGYSMIVDTKNLKYMFMKQFQYHEDEDTHPGLYARTRLGDPTVELIIIFRKDKGYFVDPNYNIPYMNENFDLVYNNSITISKKSIKFEFENLSNYSEHFSESRFLKQKNILILEEYKYDINDIYTLYYDKYKGLIIHKKD